MADRPDIENIEADISFDDGTSEKVSLDSSEFSEKKTDKKEDETTTPKSGVVVGTKEKKKKSPILVIILVFILIAVACGGYFLWTTVNKDKNSSNEEKNADQVAMPDLQIDGNSLSDFDLSFLKYELNSKNIVYSPIAIKRTLKMLSDGSSGNSKKQIDKLLGDYKVEDIKNSKNISFANILFIKEGLKGGVKKEYVNSISKYGAELKADGLKDAKTANSIVKTQTFGQIDEMFNFENADNALASSLALNLDWSKYAVWCTKSTSLPCANYYADYNGVIVDNSNDSYYSYYSDINYDERDFGSMISAAFMRVAYTVNKYDYIKEKGGEKKIRDAIEEDYYEWRSYHSEEIYEYLEKTGKEELDVDINKIADDFIKKAKADYGKVATTTDFEMFKDDDVLIFSKELKKYNNKQLRYVSIMPIGKSLKDFVNHIDAKKLLEMVKKVKAINAEDYKDGYIVDNSIFVPIYKFKYKLDLVGDLKKNGISEIFKDNNKDFSSIGIGKLDQDNIKHEVFVNFSNNGMQESILGKKSTIKEDEEYVPEYGVYISCQGEKWLEDGDLSIPCERLKEDERESINKPFLFMIIDTSNGEAWYIGAVYTPTSTYN